MLVGSALVVLLMSCAAIASADATLIGLSGTMIVPGIDVMPEGGARAAFHLMGSQDNQEGSFKGVFAFNEECEVSIMKTFMKDNRHSDQEPVFAGKYKLRPNLAVAGIIDTSPGMQETVMFLSGLPGNRVVIGAGANLGTEAGERRAHFGRYEHRFAQVDPLFFLFGAKLNLDPDTEITIDYAGMDFGLGMRHHFDERLTLDFAYISPNRVERDSRYILGANFGF